MIRVMKFGAALSVLALIPACSHSTHYHTHTPQSAAYGYACASNVSNSAIDRYAAEGDTHSYVPGDRCSGADAHASGALIGNVDGGTRYACAIRSAPMSNHVRDKAPRRTYRTYSRTVTPHTPRATGSHASELSGGPHVSHVRRETLPAHTHSKPVTTRTYTRTYTRKPKHTCAHQQTKTHTAKNCDCSCHTCQARARETYTYVPAHQKPQHGSKHH